MQILRRDAFARAGLVGNPSDGYFGKTISLSVPNFQASVVLYEWDNVEVVPTDLDQYRFSSVHELVQDVRLHGYYGAMRLLKATIKRFVEYCVAHKYELHERNFSLRYESNIPRQVGLAGSSAIIVATLRCLMDFYNIQIPLHIQPSLALSVEHSELGITAGLQDRVIQVYEGLVFMDFAEEHMRRHEAQEGFACGMYTPLPVEKLPPLYVAYNTRASEPTEVVHDDLLGRYQRGEQDVHAAMGKFAELAAQAHRALLTEDWDKLAYCIDENFNTRRAICQLLKSQVAMVEVARSVGATAKFCGSGGAIIGAYRDEDMFAALSERLARIGCKTIHPALEPKHQESFPPPHRLTQVLKNKTGTPVVNGDIST